MTRQELIEQAAKRYIKDIVTPLPASLMTAFIKGAEYADQNPVNYDGKAMLYVLNKGVKQGYKDAVEKACEWLKDNHADIFIRYIRGYDTDDEIELLKKYMEDETE